MSFEIPHPVEMTESEALSQMEREKPALDPADVRKAAKGLPLAQVRWLRRIAGVPELSATANNHDLIGLKRRDLIEFAGPVFKGQRYWRVTPLGAAVAQKAGILR